MLKIRGTFSFRLKSTAPPTPINCCWKWKPSPLAWNANIWRIHYKILLFDEGENKRLQTTGWFCSIHRTWTGYRSGVMTPSGGGINKKDFGFRLGFIYIFFCSCFCVYPNNFKMFYYQWPKVTLRHNRKSKEFQVNSGFVVSRD